ncbi:hypothetical protein J6590_022586 [Homalodisca vitripennis]|nr:hypothetical protein J6590_022586 [Homalodisca vitripennis]
MAPALSYKPVSDRKIISRQMRMSCSSGRKTCKETDQMSPMKNCWRKSACNSAAARVNKRSPIQRSDGATGTDR